MTDRCLGRVPLGGGRGRLLLLLSIAACGPAGVDSARVAVRDSAGIAIVENASPDDSTTYAWWRLERPVLEIGGETGAPGHDLFRVASALRLRDGRIVVANDGTAELRFFEAAGEFTHAAGRRGGGPGEFQSIAWLAAQPTTDSLFAFDSRASRISVFGPDGEFARDFPFGGTAGRATPVGWFPDGTFAGRLSLVLRAGADSPPPQGLQRPDIAIVRLDAGGTLTDTLGVFPGAERFIRVNGASGQITSIEVVTPLFGRTPYHAVTGNALVAATQDEPEFRMYDASGALLRIVRTGRAPEPITGAHRAALIGRRLENVPEEARSRVREGMESVPTAGTVPPYGSLLVDRAGNLWLADYDGGLGAVGRWTVYDADGRGMARIVLPERFTPFDIGPDWILGRELDELDVEHVRSYRYTR